MLTKQNGTGMYRYRTVVPSVHVAYHRHSEAHPLGLTIPAVEAHRRSYLYGDIDMAHTALLPHSLRKGFVLHDDSPPHSECWQIEDESQCARALRTKSTRGSQTATMASMEMRHASGPASGSQLFCLDMDIRWICSRRYKVSWTGDWSGPKKVGRDNGSWRIQRMPRTALGRRTQTISSFWKVLCREAVLVGGHWRG